jgi:hypothetical protein
MTTNNAIVALYQSYAEAEAAIKELQAGLFSRGLSKDSTLRYETAFNSDKFVLIAEGSNEEMDHAREIISRTPAETLVQHQPAQARVAVA